MYYKWTRGHTQFAFFEPDQSKRQALLNDLYVQHFGLLSSGTFVEVGAHNGIDCGMTTPLADLGWRGVYVEPNPVWASVCNDNHRQNPKVEVACVAIGNRNCWTTLYGNDAGATVSETFRVEVASRLSWAGNHNTWQQVPMITLDTLLHKCEIEPGFEVLSVDVEGFEVEVFEGFSLKHWKPQMMIVEMADNHPDMLPFVNHVSRYAALRERIESAGYSEVHRDIANSVFVWVGTQ